MYISHIPSCLLQSYRNVSLPRPGTEHRDLWTMDTLADLIRKLTDHPEVVGLLEYGNARHQDETVYGDYDLFVFLRECDPEIESLHFYVGTIPVDLNLRTLDDIRAVTRVEGFESVLLDGRIIHDPSGEVFLEIEALRDRRRQSPTPAFSPDKIAGLRHGAKHTFDTLRDGRQASTTLGRYMLHQCVYWALPQYFGLRGLEYRGEKHALPYLRRSDPELYDLFDWFYVTVDFERQVDLARQIETRVLAPVGGPWQDGEVLVFGDRKKGLALFRRLCGVNAHDA